MFERDGSPLGRPSGSGQPTFPVRFLRNLNKFVLMLLVAVAAGLLLSPGDDDSLVGLPELAQGDRSPRTVKSPRNFEIADPETTERLRKEAVLRVRPSYDLLGGLGGQAKRRLEVAFGLAKAPHGAEASGAPNPGDTIGGFMRSLGVYLPQDAQTQILAVGFSDEVRDAAVMVVRKLYELRIIDDKELLKLQSPEGIQISVLSPTGKIQQEESLFEYDERILGIDQARVRVDEVVAEELGHLPAQARQGVSVLAKSLLVPNLVRNDAETARRSAQARSAVKSVVIPIKRGETVIRAGERVTDRHLLILKGMARELAAQSRYQIPIGSGAIILLLILALYHFNRQRSSKFLSSQRDIAFAATAFLGTLLLIWGGYAAAAWLADGLPLGIGDSVYRYLIPVAAGPLVASAVLGGRVVPAFLVLSAVTAGWVMDKSLGFAVYALVGSLAACSVPLGDRPLARLVPAGLRAGFAQAAVVVALALLDSRLVVEETSIEIVSSLCSGLLTSLLAVIALPSAEALFGYTTNLKLASLANLNHPLLRELLVQAPGSYHHSILVGALAEAGARGIGASALLAKVGGYYHDIGKIKNPRVFEENLRGPRAASGVSRAPDEAAQIRMHVADGLELAAKHRIGQPILEIIAQHHGTSPVRPSESASSPGLPGGTGEEATRSKSSEQDLRFFFAEPPEPEASLPRLAYGGPKPLSREAALVLLADQVETAVRKEIERAGPAKTLIEPVVRAVLEEAVRARQLEDSPMTLRDVRAVETEFAHVLASVHQPGGRPETPKPTAGSGPRLVVAPTVEKGQLN